MSRPRPLDEITDGATYTMAELHALDPSGTLAKQARRQIDDLPGLIERTRANLAAPTPRTGEDNGPTAATKRPGLGRVGDRLPPQRPVRRGTVTPAWQNQDS